MPNYRILFCTSEAYPLIKTGGLADVAGSLPRALSNLKHDVRMVLPAYQSVLAGLKQRPSLHFQTRIGDYPVGILQSTLPGTRVPLWLVDCPPLFDRPGNPYLDAEGGDWPDNADRFGLFNQVIVRLANNDFGMNWQPQLVHGNDWQTGLAPALLSQQALRPATVFTIHNLAYQGTFDRGAFERLKLPESLWHYEQLEYHGGFAFLKGGLVFADRINTVSPNYAHEIQTPAFGHGLEGLLQHRADRLSGIINGIDERVWNPGTDKRIASTFNRQQIKKKVLNKQALQDHFKLDKQDGVLMLGLISRLAEQKGIDMLLDILPQLMKSNVQLVLLGSGNKEYEQALQLAAKQFAGQLGVHIGYDEDLAHLIEAGIDAFLMPSRFEPCGLNQMYSQRYGSLPIVAPVGGLSDTVTDASEENLKASTASGFVMPEVSAEALLQTIERAVSLYAKSADWVKLQRTAMQQDYSWANSAAAYTELYTSALRDHPVP